MALTHSSPSRNPVRHRRLALHLVELLYEPVTAQACQLLIEYDPQPPFDAGAAHKVDSTVMASSRARELATQRN